MIEYRLSTQFETIKCIDDTSIDDRYTGPIRMTFQFSVASLVSCRSAPPTALPSTSTLQRHRHPRPRAILVACSYLLLRRDLLLVSLVPLQLHLRKPL